MHLEEKMDFWVRPDSYNFAPLIAWAGGIWTLLSVILGNIVVRFNRRLYLFELINDIIRVPKLDADHEGIDFFESADVSQIHILWHWPTSLLYDRACELLLECSDVASNIHR